LEISLFGSIVAKINSKVFHSWHSDPYMDRLRPSLEYIVKSQWNKYYEYNASELFLE
jgi:hypothetical protein